MEVEVGLIVRVELLPEVVHVVLPLLLKLLQLLPVFCCHWYVNGIVPATLTVKVAGFGAITDWLVGFDEIDTGVQPLVTVKVAALLVAE